MRLLLVLIFSFTLSACCDDKTAAEATELLYSASAKERNQAAMALASCGSSSAKAVPRLTELLYDENVGVQSSAAFALRKIDTPAARRALDAATAARKSK